MTVHALAQGAIFRGVELKISKAGRDFALTTLKCRDGDAVAWIKVLAFSEHVIEALQRLNDGDVVAVQGALKSEAYTDRAGEARVSLTIMADAVQPLRAPPRERKPKTCREVSQVSAPQAEESRRERCAGLSDPDLDDPLPGDWGQP